MNKHGAEIRQRSGVDCGSGHPGDSVCLQGCVGERGAKHGVGKGEDGRDPRDREVSGGADPQSVYGVLLGAIRGERGSAGQSGAAGGRAPEESRAARAGAGGQSGAAGQRHEAAGEGAEDHQRGPDSRPAARRLSDG